jgi:hypothetical protein
MQRLLRVTLVVAGLSVGHVAKADLIFDATADFSATNNPNGVWSYGQSATLTSAFQLYTQHGLNNENHPPADLLDTWNAGTGGNHLYPSVLHNGTGSPISSDGFTYPAGQLGFHPGPAGQYSVVRFTVPTSGLYSLTSAYNALDPGLGSHLGHVDVHVLLNGVSLFDGSVDGVGSPASFNTSLALATGDQLDFKVGYGSNMDYDSDSTGLVAVLSTTAVPEPSSLALLGIATVGSGCCSMAATEGARRSHLTNG